MSLKILTFGYDACHRWAVMRLAGFRVDECESIRDFRQKLMASTDVDAVIMVQDIVSIPPEAIIAAKSYFDGPLVLFESRCGAENEHVFDLRVPNLTEPSEWLQRIQAVIGNYTRARSAKLRN